MTIKDKNLDKMLRKLDNFQPDARADWDAFYKKNKNRIPVRGSKGIVSKSFVRVSLVLITLIAVFTGGYFYFQPSSPTDENVKSEQNITGQTPKNPAGAAHPDSNLQQEAIRQNTVILPQTGAPVMDNNAAGAVKITSGPGAIIQETLPQSNIHPADNMIIDEPDAGPVPSKSDSTIEEPVIIRKTVIIKDTIRVSKPVKKVK
jgi:hypothetical protein